MACYHPNIMTFFPDGFTGKDNEKVKNKDGSLRHWKFQGAGYERQDGDFLFYDLKYYPNSYVPLMDYDSVNDDGEFSYSVMVPCQQCYGCRIDYSRHWADRIVMESMVSEPDSYYFVTLTYSDENLSHLYTDQNFTYVSQGQTLDLPGLTLCKKDLQDFNKRLREYYSRKYGLDNIRFFASGEYGPKTRRPHYHVCYFNLLVDDLEFYSNNFRGDVLYNSPTLEKLWGKGYVVIGKLNWECAAYTARYVVKKYKGKESDDFYASMGGVIPEFSLASRRPGIAAGFYEKYRDKIYEFDSIQLPSSRSHDGRTTVPRYFDKLLEKDIDLGKSDINLEKIKSQRRANAEDRTFERRILSGLFDEEYFAMKEKSFKDSFSLIRSLDI